MSEQSSSAADNTGRKKLAKKYELVHNILFLVDIVYTLAIILLFINMGGEGGYSSRLVGWIGSWCANYWLQILFYMIIITTVYMISLLPLSFYSGFYMEHKYELSNETFSSWIKDKGKSLLLNIVFMVLFGEIVYLFLNVSQQAWWLWVGIVWILFGIVLSNIAPVVIIPLFYKLKPLEDTELTNRLVDLANRVKANILGVYEIELSAKTKKANAALAGLGNTKRILLGDTLLKNFTHEEIEVILAHELGHFYYNHIWKLIFFGGIISFGGLYVSSLVLESSVASLGFENITNIAAFPIFLICMFIFTLISTPLNNLYSRILERQADTFALKQTKAPKHFISSMKKLAELNLADEEPHPVIEFLLHSHPSIGRRVKFAEQFTD